MAHAVPQHEHRLLVVGEVCAGEGGERGRGRPGQEVLTLPERRVLSSEVHLEVLEEVVVLHGGEGDEHANTARESCVDQTVRPSWDQSGLGLLERKVSEWLKRCMTESVCYLCE